MFDKIKKLMGQTNDKAQQQAQELRKQGNAHLSEGRFADAIDLYLQALTVTPDNADLHIALSFVLGKQGDVDAATGHLQQALSLEPGNAEAHFMLGNIVREKGELARAVEHYSQAIASDPRLNFAYKKLSDTFRQLDLPEQAKEVLHRATAAFPDTVNFPFELAGMYFMEQDYANTVALLGKVLQARPDDPHANMNMARAYLGMEMTEAAIPYYEKAVQLIPENAALLQDLGNAYQKTGRLPEALACFREVIRLEPDNPIQHLVAALSGETTATAPTDYVEKLFDHFAETFDTDLVGSLQYNVPAQLLALLQAHRSLPAGELDVLDLGCGTGLFGKEIAPYVNTLVGVDLSQKMLDKAELLGVYDHLEHQDILAMIQDEPDADYDLIAATDVFVYIGKLDDIFREAKRILKPQGILAFSAESLDALPEAVRRSGNGDFQLNETGRYAHGMRYLSQLADASGLSLLASREGTGRINSGKPVVSYFMLLVNDKQAPA